jgi:hypothetical protein
VITRVIDRGEPISPGCGIGRHGVALIQLNVAQHAA